MSTNASENQDGWWKLGCFQFTKRLHVEKHISDMYENSRGQPSLLPAADAHAHADYIILSFYIIYNLQINILHVKMH